MVDKENQCKQTFCRLCQPTPQCTTFCCLDVLVLEKYVPLCFVQLLPKSSTINSFITICHNLSAPETKKAEVRKKNEVETKTVKFAKYALTQHVNVFDTVGWTVGSNYKSAEFNNILEGRVHEGTKISDLVTKATQTFVNPIDAVAFCVDPTLMANADVFLPEMKQFVQLAVQKNKVVFFVITKVDDIASLKKAKLRTNEKILDLLNSNEEICTMKEQIMDAMEDIVPDVKIFPIMNYIRTDNNRNASIEKTIQTIFDYIISTQKQTSAVVGKTIWPHFDIFQNEEFISFK